MMESKQKEWVWVVLERRWILILFLLPIFPLSYIISMQKLQINGHIELSVNVLLLLQYQIMLAIMFSAASDSIAI